MRLGSGIAISLALLATALPLASAQAPTNAPSSLQMEIQAYDYALEHGVPAQTKIRVDYCYFVLGTTALTSTRTFLAIAEAPAWAIVHISPSTLHFPIYTTAAPQSTVCAPTQVATLTITLADDAPLGAVATVKIRADAAANQPIGPAQTQEGVLVQATREPCHEQAASAESGDVALLTEENADDLTTQTAGAVPVRASAVPIALGLAGVGAGGVVAWRRRRA